MPVNVAPAVTDETSAPGEPGCSAAGSLPPGDVAAGKEVAANEATVGAEVAEPDKPTAEARSRSINERSDPYVASRSTP